MAQLPADSLIKRQKELNTKVNETVANKVDFEVVKAEPEDTDVDRLFKIDLAAKYKNVDYAIETIKSGDSLYISRVLKKALWLFDDEHSKVMNIDNLHHDIFPCMSNKMTKKLLTAASIHLKNKDRIAEFFIYCKQAKMTNLAEKFLLRTDESFKLKLINERDGCIFENSDDTFLKRLIEDSFVLFEAYLNHTKLNVNSILNIFSYFYTISDVKYLELLEKHAVLDTYPKLKLGLRISKHIVSKRKERILANPKFYFEILNIGKLLRHSSVSDIKLYSVGVLPKASSNFWNINYYSKYKPFIQAIPEPERYAFIKKIFTDKYPHDEFEMSDKFYTQNYYELMTATEKEAWAICHIDSNIEILGPGRDHVWYKFVNFERAFPEMTKKLKNATNQFKRIKLLKVILHSAKTNRDIETALNYYYERHVNERKNNKENFLMELVNMHNVFQFDDKCWKALNKLFYSVDVYSKTCYSYCNSYFKIISILYHIINDIEFPNALKHHIESDISMDSAKQYIEMLDEEQKQHVYTYITNFYLKRVENFTPSNMDEKCIKYINLLLQFMWVYKKTKEDIPDAIMEFVNHDFASFKYRHILEVQLQDETYLTGDELVRLLKVDTKLVIEKILEEDIKFFRLRLKINKLLQKLKIYFPRDEVTQKFLELFHNLLNQTDNNIKDINMAVYGIFQLSDEKTKIDFMNKYAPIESKIDHSSIQNDVLLTRAAICSFACYARPPVPLSSILQYLKGDYVRFCSPMFHMYLENLPLPLCLKFVESLLDAPVSVQKHGLRLAFKCFSIENVKTVVLNAWKNTKNVSLRNVIYRTLHEKTVTEQNKEMYKLLKKLTLDLHDEDVDGIFYLITSTSLGLHGCNEDFIEVVWSLVEKFNDIDQNVSRKVAVLKLINIFLPLINKDIVSKIVADYIDTFGVNITQSFDTADKFYFLNMEKWDLFAHYIVYFFRIEEHRPECMEMVKIMLGKCLEGWYDVTDKSYVYRPVFVKLVETLKRKRFLPHPSGTSDVLPDIESYENTSLILDVILNNLQNTLPLHEIYMHIWDIRISIMYRKIIKEYRERYPNDRNQEVIEEAAVECGKRIGNIVKEFVQNGTYFSYFNTEIAAMVKNSSSDLNYYLEPETKVNLHFDHILVGIARGLLELKTGASDLLAVQIMPLNPDFNVEYFKSVYVKMQNLTDVETKCIFYQKFNDFKWRRFE